MSCEAGGMTMPQRPKKAPKSKNGCQRCKLKRLKCDETKPACTNCQRRGILCPGYQQLLKWSTKYEVFKPAASVLRQGDTQEEKCDGGSALIADIYFPEKASEELASKSTDNNSDVPPSHDATCFGQQSSHQKEATCESTALVPVCDIAEAQERQSGYLVPEQQQPSELLVGQPSVELRQLLEACRKSIIERHAKSRSGGDMPISALGTPPTSQLLPRNHYKISPASHISDSATALVEHYFRNTCALYSAFDSALNPFRTTIGRIWDSTPSIYYAIQSMAAAQLANSIPRMSMTGLKMQRKAYASLQEEVQLFNSGKIASDRILLTILLLGLSTSWHDSSDLGLHHLTAARSLIYPKLLEADQAGDNKHQRQLQFFQESLIYWEMLIGFVSDEPDNSFSGMTQQQDSEPTNLAALGPSPLIFPSKTTPGKLLPHPWTGIAPRIQMLFAEVGKLIRAERAEPTWMSFLVTEGMDASDRLTRASYLEEELLSTKHPLLEDLVDTGDRNTSRTDFLRLAEGYRCAGLLEIYRIFPDILRKRLGVGFAAWEDAYFDDLPSIQSSSGFEAYDLKLWISSLAIHTLNILRKIPSSSGTCCLQPILLVAASAELRYVSSLDYFDLHANDKKVADARRFVDARLDDFARRLPSKPLVRMMELIKEVWRRSDRGDDVFWMDVMIENGWQTVMG